MLGKNIKKIHNAVCISLMQHYRESLKQSLPKKLEILPEMYEGI